MKTIEPEVVRRKSPLGWPAKLLFGVGGLAESLKSATFGLFLLFFYTNVLGVSGTLVGAVTAVGLLWDAVVDPSIGRFSDNLRSSFGRRHTPMLIGALASGPLFFAIFAPPEELSSVGLALWLLVFGLLLRSAHSLFVVPYYALGAELSDDYQERSVISATRVVFVFAGTLIAVSLSFAVFFAAAAPEAGASAASVVADAKFTPGPYRAVGASFGALMTAAGLAAIFGTLSRRGSLRSAPVASPTKISLLGEAMELLRQPAFRALAVSASLFFMGSVANATLTISYLTYYAGLADSADISRFQVAFFVGALLGTPFWMRMTRRFEKRSLYAAACLAIALVTFSAYALVGEGRLIEPGRLGALAAGNALAGWMAAALWILPVSMLADVVDADELLHGRRREATMFGVYSLGHQVAAGLAIAVSGVLLDAFARLEPGQPEQTAEAAHRIGLLFAALPGAIFVIAFVLILGYDLNRDRLRSIQDRLAQGYTAASAP